MPRPTLVNTGGHKVISRLRYPGISSEMVKPLLQQLLDLLKIVRQTFQQDRAHTPEFLLLRNTIEWPRILQQYLLSRNLP
jgi:hypothetical protein